MNHTYSELYRRARPYLDTRHNEVHIAISYRFAQRLLACYPDADEGVVLPAMLLHDIGWKLIPEDQHLVAFGPKMQRPELRRYHETEGARMAGEILAAVGYDPARSAEIVAIIDGHDTRDEALSLNDRLMKDADKLWRFTQTGIGIDYQRFGVGLREHLSWLGQRIEGWLFTPEAKRIARQLHAEAEAALLL